jgi:16S rRNA (cytosine967-C5)-methyltransferase
LEVRRNEQTTVLDRAALLAKPGGRIVYITCSILPEENDDVLSAFLERHEGFNPVSHEDLLATSGLDFLKNATRRTAYGLQLTPLQTGTDGFFIALLRRGS